MPHATRLLDIRKNAEKLFYLQTSVSDKTEGKKTFLKQQLTSTAGKLDMSYLERSQQFLNETKE